MTIQHKDIQSGDCHEPKGIGLATTADAGKVITPSSATNGISVLRAISAGKDLDLRVVALVDAANIASNSDTTDLGTVLITANRILSAPSGTPRNGQEIVYRVTQDGTGGRTLTFDAIFTLSGGSQPLDLAANATTYLTFRWNSTLSKWQGVGTQVSFTEAGTFTPTLTFDTPGDVAVVYTTQAGRYWKVGSLYVIEFYLACTPTYTTAAGDARFGGLPVAPGNYGGPLPQGEVTFVTTPTWPAGTSQIKLLGSVGNTYCKVAGIGSAIASANFGVAQFPSAAAITLWGNIVVGA